MYSGAPLKLSFEGTKGWTELLPFNQLSTIPELFSMALSKAIHRSLSEDQGVGSRAETGVVSGWVHQLTHPRLRR